MEKQVLKSRSSKINGSMKPPASNVRPVSVRLMGESLRSGGSGVEPWQLKDGPNNIYI